MDDVSLSQIDYKWVEQCNDKNKLRKGLKLLKDDGGYFLDLERAIEEKLKQIDKKFVAQSAPVENISEEEKKKFQGDINNWENAVKDIDKLLQDKDQKTIYEAEKDRKIAELEKKKLADNEKFKGNDFMKTKDFNDAIKHYTTSIKLNPVEETTYCNRALAYIKLKRNTILDKEFESGLQDCNVAINLKKDYSKAYYRRALCLVGLKKFQEAFDDLIYLLAESPNNQGYYTLKIEITSEINTTKEKWLEFVGKEEYQRIEPTIIKKIESANKGIKDTKPNTKTEGASIRVNIEESQKKDNPPPPKEQVKTSEKQKQSTNQPTNSTETKQGFKKVKIVEEDSEMEGEAIEKKFEEFWKNKNEVAKKFEILYKEGKFEEILELARLNLSECQNYLPELKSKPALKSKLESKISELHSFIQMCSKKVKPGEKKAENNEVKPSNEKPEEEKKEKQKDDIKKFHKTPIIAEVKMENATKIAEEEMSMDEYPKTANGFEKAFSSLKKNSEAFYKYLAKFTPENLVKIFEKIEMTFDLVVGILNAQKQFGLNSKDAFLFSLRYFISISKTKKFNLMKSFLKGAVRDGLSAYIQEGKLKFSLDDEESGKVKEVEKAFF